jgi:signal transduction histidine kinase/ligand-binding sensor domain-containing protein
MLSTTRLLAAALTVLLTCAPAAALNPKIGLQDLNHASWSEKDGVPADVQSMAQTPDGWLWLGTVDGLYRFDGVHFDRFHLPAHPHIVRNRIFDLHAVDNGDLMISYILGGLSILHPDGTLVDLIDPDADHINAIGSMTMDRDGTVWAAALDGLHRYAKGRWETMSAGPDWATSDTRSVLLDQYGRLWASNGQALYLYNRAAGKVERVGGPEMHGSLLQSPDGRLWVGEADSVRLVPAAPLERRLPRAPDCSQSEARWSGQFDRDGNLWALRCPYGICRVANAGARQQAVIVPSREAGDKLDQHWQLSALSTNVVLEDREGNMWVSTQSGLDRFRENKLLPARIPGPTGVYSMASDTEGALWVAEPVTGALWTLSADAAPVRAAGRFVSVVANDRDGALLLGGKRTIERRYRGKVSEIMLPPGRDGKAVDLGLIGMLDDGKVLWIASMQTGLMGLVGGKWLPSSAFNLPKRIFMSAPGGPGQLWLSHNDGKLSLYDDGRLSEHDISLVGVESGIFPGPQLAVGGDRGLAVMKGTAFVLLKAANPDVLRNVTGMAITPDGDRWLNAGKGVVHVRRQDWDAALAQPERPLVLELINVLDGYPGRAALDNRLPTVFNAGNGRLWLRATGGIVRLETAQLAPNRVQPIVQLLRLNTVKATYPMAGALRLPADAHSFNIQYTAPGLRKPEGMRFQYQLSGVDPSWQDGGVLRTAYYTNIGPGTYTFQVRAVNEDGVVSAVVTSAPIEVAPTLVQTWWFKALCLLAVALLMYGLYRYRVRTVTARLAQQLQVRMEERERLARTLHDTILQSVQAIVLRLHLLVNDLPAQGGTRASLERLLDNVDSTVAEGRDQVHDLRSGVGRALEPAVTAAGAQLAELYPATRLRLVVTGTPAPLGGAVADEVCGIVREAMRNGFRHAGASEVVVSIGYARAGLAVQVSDNGSGMPAEVLAAGHKAGHWGLVGMRERAARIDATLSIKSSPESGTQVGLSLPGKAA